MSRRAVIVGADGQLGFHVAKAALEAGFGVELLIRRKNTNIEKLIALGARFVAVNFRDRASYREQLRWADLLFHVAADLTTPIAQQAAQTEQLLNAAVTAEIPAIIYTSSADAVGSSREPQRIFVEDDRASAGDGPDLDRKLAAEQVCDRLIRDHNVDLRRLYPAWLLGANDPGGTAPHKIVRNFLRHGRRITFPGGVSVGSAVEAGRAHVAAALRGQRCGRYLLGGENITFDQLFGTLASLSGKQPPRARLPAWASSALGLETDEIPSGVYRWYNSGRAIAELGYSIPPARELLSEAVLAERKRAAGTNALFQKPVTRTAAYGSEQRMEAPPLVLTGIPGWIGNRFVDILLNGDRRGYRYPYREVRLLVQKRHEALLDLPPQFRVVALDAGHRDRVAQALAGVKTVIHLAESVYPKRLQTLHRVNTEATRFLVDACVQAGVRRFLYVSSDAVCEGSSGQQRIFDEGTSASPASAYGRSKWQAEQYIREQTEAGLLDGTILRGLRFFGPFAPARQERFLARLRQPKQIIAGDGERYQGVTHIDNMVAALLACENVAASVGKTYWIGDEKADYTVDEIYQLLCEGLGQTYHPRYVPRVVCSAAQWAGRTAERFGWVNATLVETGKSASDSAGSIDAAVRDFGFRPVISFAEYASELGRRGQPAPVARKAAAGSRSA